MKVQFKQNHQNILFNLPSIKFSDKIKKVTLKNKKINSFISDFIQISEMVPKITIKKMKN